MRGAGRVRVRLDALHDGRWLDDIACECRGGLLETDIGHLCHLMVRTDVILATRLSMTDAASSSTTIKRAGWMAMLQWPNLISGSPFSPPWWRWELANLIVSKGRLLVSTGCQIPRVLPDAGVDRVVRFLTASRQVRGHSAIREALELFKAKASPRTSLVESDLLTGAKPKVVAERTAIAPNTVVAYRTVFFDITNRLKHRDWTARMVIGPGLWVGFKPSEITLLWRAFACYGGLRLLEAVIDVCRQDRLVEDCRELRRGTRVAVSDRLRRSIRLAIAASMLSPRDSAIKLADLQMQTRRIETIPKHKGVASVIANSVDEMLTATSIASEPENNAVCTAVA